MNMKPQTKHLRKTGPHLWKKGAPSPNPRGRGLGTKNFTTIYKEALISLSRKIGKEPVEFELEIIEKGIAQARKGDYKFYKDLLDRIFGQAIQKKEVTGADGNPLEVSIENKTKINKLLESFIKKNE
jgi:hypothetical protein